MVVAVGDVDLSRRVDEDPVGLTEFDLVRWSTDSCTSDISGPGDSGDIPSSGIVTTNDMVVGVRDQNRASAIKAQVYGAAEGGI